MSGNAHRREQRARVLRADVLTSTDEVVEVTNVRRMPVKRPGFHRWQAMIVHALSDEQAEALADGGGKVLFDASSVVMMPEPFCIDCEGRFDDVRGKRCEAGDEWRNPDA